MTSLQDVKTWNQVDKWGHVQRKIIEYLDLHNSAEGITPREIYHHYGLTRIQVGKAITPMIKREWIVRIARGRYILGDIPVSEMLSFLLNRAGLNTDKLQNKTNEYRREIPTIYCEEREGRTGDYWLRSRRCIEGDFRSVNHE